MATFQPEDDSEPPAPMSFTDVNKQHMVDEVSNFDSSLDGTIVLNPSHCEDISKMLKQMQERSDFCDVSLKICNFEQSIEAHRCILAANSPVFYQILQNFNGHEITIPSNTSLEDVSVDAFNCLLSFMYTGELRLNLLNVESLLRLSSFFQIQDVDLLCARYMQDVIDITNWAYFQNLTTKYELGDETELKISEFISANLPFLVHSDGIVTITHEEMFHILRKENTKRESEMEVCKLEIILKWISSDSARVDYFSDLINCVDVTLVRPNDVGKIASNYSHILTSVPEEPWIKFQQNVNDHIIIQGDYNMENDKKYLANTPDYAEFQVSASNGMELILLNTQEENQKLEEHPIQVQHSSTDPLERHLTGIGNACDKENLTSVLSVENTLKEDNVILKQPNKVNRKLQDKRKTRCPVKLSVKTRISKSKSRSARGKNWNKFRKPRTKAVCTQVNSQEIKFDLEESSDEKKEPHINTGTRESGARSDSEYGDITPVGFISENWDDETPKSDTKSPKVKEVTTFQNPKVIIIEHNKIKGKVNHPLLGGSSSTSPRIKRIRAKKATTEEEMYQCEKCSRKFETPSALRHHMKGHGATQPFLCEICGFSTIHFASMNVHKRQHNDQLRYRCTWPDCTYTAIRRSRLDDHVAAHEGIKNYVCSTCGKAFSGRKHLHRHEQIHRDIKQKCTECTYESPRKDKLRDHIKKHHPDLALQQGIMTPEQMQNLRPPAKSRKSSTKKSRKASKVTAETREDIRHEEDQKAASVLESESILTASQTALNTAVQSANYIPLPHLLPGAQSVPDDLFQYIAIAQPQQQTSGLPSSNTSILQPATSQQQYVVSDSAVQASDAVTLTTFTSSQSSQVPTSIESAQQWYYVQYSGQ